MACSEPSLIGARAARTPPLVDLTAGLVDAAPARLRAQSSGYGSAPR